MALLLSYFVLFCQNVFDPKKGFNDVLQNCFKPHTGLNIASPVARCTPQEGVRFWSDEMELNGVIWCANFVVTFRNCQHQAGIERVDGRHVAHGHKHKTKWCTITYGNETSIIYNSSEYGSKTTTMIGNCFIGQTLCLCYNLYSYRH
jgi:hypothetical protein